MSLAQPTSTLSPGDAVLVVIDVQARLVPAMHEFGPVRANLRRLILGAGQLEVPVVTTEQYPRGLGPTVPGVAKWLPEIRIEKVEFGCFGCPGFEPALGGRRTLLLCGIEAHVCVLQTALGGLERGYFVVVAADAVTSRSARNRDLALAQLAAAGATVTSTESILFQLLGRAGTEVFRAVSRLVR